jgi:hypothetical protein
MTRGRPKKQIDAKLVRVLAGIHCTQEEIAVACGCSVDTLDRRFKQEMAEGLAEGKASLRRMQWHSAQKGNVAMQIWLGKQILGQSDKRNDDDGDGSPIPLKYNLGE